MPETHKSDFQYLVSREIGECWGVFTIGSILKSPSMSSYPHHCIRIRICNQLILRSTYNTLLAVLMSIGHSLSVLIHEIRLKVLIEI